MHIHSRIHKNGLTLNLRKKSYSVKYPKRIWDGLSQGFKHALRNHLSFLSTIHLPFFLDTYRLVYDIPKPRFKGLFMSLMRRNIPYFADSDSVPAQKYFDVLERSQYLFEGQHNGGVDYDAQDSDRSLIGFTFGKESLLLYALSRELGMGCDLVYFAEDDPFGYYENMHKRKLAKGFEKRYSQLNFIENSLSLLRFYEHFDVEETQVGWTRLLTEYVLMELPLAAAFGSEYILLGNEKSCDDYYVSKEGYECNPSYDQSSEWTKSLNKLTQGLTDGAVETASPVMQLQELAIIKVLHQRYRDMGRYQMSCFTDDDYGKHDRWCHHCTKCARNYVMMLAAGVNPREVGFTRNMMGKSFAEYYSLFPEKTTAHTVYDVSGLGRDEQLLSFLLATENGARGRLIDRFRRGFMKEARAREDELRRKYLTVYRDHLPKRFREARSIYKEELAKDAPRLKI